MSTVVLDNLRNAFPEAALDFLTEPAPAEILLDHPVLRRVVVLHRAKGIRGWVSAASFIRALRREQYELVIDFFGNPRSALLTWFSRAPHRVGYDYRIRKRAYNHIVRSRANELHEVDWHLDALTTLGIPIISRKPQVLFGEEEERFAEQFMRELGWPDHPIAAINVSGGWPAKRWPIERFAALIDAISEKSSWRFMAIWGPGERANAEKLAELTQVPVMPTPPTTLKKLASLLQKAAIMITNDSGPMHIAAALGTPCVAIFGPTNPKLQGPYGEQHCVVRKESLPCLGCNRLNCEHTSCMGQLTTAEVFVAFQACVKKNNLFPI